MKTVKNLTFFLFLGILAAVPALKSNGKYQFIDDASYYWDRTNEVLKGFWGVGNPYFYEHRNDLGISFFIPDWLSAIPGSFFMWPLISGVLIYVVLKQFKISGKLLYLGTLFCFLSVYNFIVRPTSLQTIYPFFLLLLIAIKVRKVWFMVAAASITFYIYPYLWQLTVIIVFLYSVILKFDRRYLSIPLLSLPAIYYQYLQISSPYYWETMERIGLVHTRLPTVSSFFYLLVLTLPIIFLYKIKFFLFFYIAFGTLLFSNVLTGMELETANHVGRFVILFGSLAIVYLISQSKRFTFLAVIWLFIFRSNFGALFYTPTYESGINRSLGKATINNYVLFNPLGGLHLMSSDEVLERYLVWKYPEKLSLDKLIMDSRMYMGAGPSIHQVAQHNYRIKICRMLKQDQCGETKDVSTYYGEAYFQDILNRYNNIIAPNIKHYYQKYHIAV